MLGDAKNYLSTIAQRKKESHIHREFQFIGLEVAQMLGDIAHKALYIKLAKIYGKDRILPLAKDVADRRGIRNKGAYFMKLLYSSSTNNELLANKRMKS